MKRPTDKYNDPGPRTLRTLLVRGGLLLVLAVVIGSLAGWTKRVRATDAAKPLPDAGFAARRIGSLAEQFASAQGEMDLMRIQLDRANAIMSNSARYKIPADLAASIYDIALSEGIDPALGFQLVKIESDFKAGARSAMGAVGYTQLQVATARFYDPTVTERRLTERDLNLRIGFRFLNDLLDKFGRDTHLALLAYNRGPAKVADILARGGDPTNGYPAAVLRGYRPPSSAEPGWQ